MNKSTDKILVIALILIFAGLGYTVYRAVQNAKEENRKAEAALAAKKAQKDGTYVPQTQPRKEDMPPPQPPTREQKIMLFRFAATGNLGGVADIIDNQNVLPNFYIDIDELGNYAVFRSKLKEPLKSFFTHKDTGWSMVFAAVAAEDDALLTFLIDREADLNVQGPGGRNLFDVAFKGKNKKIPLMLLDNGVIPIIDPKDPKNYLSLALKDNDFDLAPRLYVAAVKSGVYVDNLLPDFSKALKAGNAPLVKFLLDYDVSVGVEDRFENGATPLMLASTANQETTAVMISTGAAVNAVDNNGRNALFYAIGKPEAPKVLPLLIGSGVPLSWQDNKGISPLIYAITVKDFESAQTLINSGADINVADNEGVTPLIAAATYGPTELVKELIEVAAEINVQARNGDTPLIAAARRGIYSMALLLKQKGASTSYKSGGFTASQIAAHRGHTKVADMLEGKAAISD